MMLFNSGGTLYSVTTCDFAFSDLVRRPTEVAHAADSHRRVVLHRRGAPDLELARADWREGELAQADAFARLLANLLTHVPIDEVPEVIVHALPWTRYLSDGGRLEFVTTLPSVLDACVSMETLAPLDVFLSEWRDTAAAQADPVLSEILSKPIEMPLDTPVTM